jgi:hypothetical protein
MQALFRDLASQRQPQPPQKQHFADRRNASF